MHSSRWTYAEAFVTPTSNIQTGVTGASFAAVFAMTPPASSAASGQGSFAQMCSNHGPASPVESISNEQTLPQNSSQLPVPTLPGTRASGGKASKASSGNVFDSMAPPYFSLPILAVLPGFQVAPEQTDPSSTLEVSPADLSAAELADAPRIPATVPDYDTSFNAAQNLRMEVTTSQTAEAITSDGSCSPGTAAPQKPPREVQPVESSSGDEASSPPLIACLYVQSMAAIAFDGSTLSGSVASRQADLATCDASSAQAELLADVVPALSDATRCPSPDGQETLSAAFVQASVATNDDHPVSSVENSSPGFVTDIDVTPTQIPKPDSSAVSKASLAAVASPQPLSSFGNVLQNRKAQGTSQSVAGTSGAPPQPMTSPTPAASIAEQRHHHSPVSPPSPPGRLPVSSLGVVEASPMPAADSSALTAAATNAASGHTTPSRTCPTGAPDTNNPATPRASPAMPGKSSSSSDSNTQPSTCSNAPDTTSFVSPLLQVWPEPSATSGTTARQADVQAVPGDRANVETAYAARVTPLATPVAGGPVQLARVLQNASQSEMRIGLSTSEFGNVQVRTVVHASDVGLQIGSEKGDLRSLLGNELPGIVHNLRQQDLRLTQVTFQQNGFFSSSDASQHDSNSRSFRNRQSPAPDTACAISCPEPDPFSEVRNNRNCLSILA